MSDDQDPSEFPFPHEYFDGWNAEVIDGECEICLFWKVNDQEMGGFEFCVFGWTKGGGAPYVRWDNPKELMVEKIVEGCAYFDGIRHVDYGEAGYLNYPNMEAMVEIHGRLRKLELDYCEAAAR